MFKIRFEMALDYCRICKSTDFLELLQENRVPTSQTPVRPQAQRNEAAGSLRIVECQTCSHVFNAAFEPGRDKELYSEDFAASLPTTTGYLKRYDLILSWLAENLKEKPRTAIEIGSGDFTFSKGLLRNGVEKVIAFEPSDLFKSEFPEIQHVRAYFTAAALPASQKRVGLVVMRHILEHVEDPRVLVQEIAKTSEPGTSLYIEVPNVNSILKDKRIYDFFYEHINYFSIPLLVELLKQEGFEFVTAAEWAGGQHFGVLAKFTGTKSSPDYSGVKDLLKNRKEQIPELVEFLAAFRKSYGAFFQNHSNIAVYGAGAHSITVINMLQLGPSEIPCLFDLNPHKNGRLSPLSHIPIQIPNERNVQEAKEILVIAPLHQDEIFQQLRKMYRFSGKIYGTYPDLRELT